MTDVFVDAQERHFLTVCNYIFSAIFALEMVIKVRAHR